MPKATAHTLYPNPNTREHTLHIKREQQEGESTYTRTTTLLAISNDEYNHTTHSTTFLIQYTRPIKAAVIRTLIHT